MARSLIHSGEILADALYEVGIPPSELSRRIKAPTNRIMEIICGRRSITGDTAPRPGRRFGNSAQVGLSLQSADFIFDAWQKAGRQIARLPVRHDGVDRAAKSIRPDMREDAAT